MLPTFSSRALLVALPVLLALILALTFPGAAPAQENEGENAQTAYSTLADILEDEQARDRLIGELRRLSEEEDLAGDAADSDAGAETAADDDESVPLPRRIAQLTQAAAEGVVGQFRQAGAALDTDGPAFDWAAAVRGAASLALVVVATVALFLVFRSAARPLFARASTWASGGGAGAGLIRRILAVGFAAVVDVAIILLAWVGGYAVALFGAGDGGAMDTQHSLFLNAFLLIEVFKALLRMVFASRYDGLRLLPMASADAAYWNTRLARLSGFIGYGLLLVVPIVSFEMSDALGRLVSLLLIAVAFTYALTVILGNRRLVHDKLIAVSTRSAFGFTQIGAAVLARVWHLVAIAYFAAFAVITLVNPEEALPFMVRATLLSLLAIIGGALVARLLTQVISRQISVSAETRTKYPLLEARLNAFIPTLLKVMRLIILIVVLALLLDAWDLFDLAAWAASEVGGHVIAATISVAFIVVAATLLWIAIASWIERRLNPDTGRAVPGAREQTLLALFRSAVAIIIVTLTVMIVLSEIGINIGPLIAGAGVLGLAIGFGAQKLVQDVITGVFIQLDNAINTGDVITAGAITGTAERLSIRSVGIRDLAGTYHIVPFSYVDTVSNYMRDFAYHVGVYDVSHREDTDEVIARLQDAFEELRADSAHAPNIIGDLEVHGVTALGDSSVTVRVLIKTPPGAQWSIGREYNRLVKRHLDAAGIEIPFPHLRLYFGEDKAGHAPPANVRVLEHGTRGKRPAAEEPGHSGDEPENITRPRPGTDFDPDPNEE